MTFVDSNVPMYLVGADHPHKVDARRLLERLVADGERLVTDVEVEIFSIHDADVERAKTIVLGKHGLSARDAIHVAVMEREGVRRILTFDAGFDGAPGIDRVSG